MICSRSCRAGGRQNLDSSDEDGIFRLQGTSESEIGIVGVANAKSLQYLIDPALDLCTSYRDWLTWPSEHG